MTQTEMGQGSGSSTPLPLTEFLLARIAEDEADADGIDRNRIYDDARWNVTRVLAECEAKRRIVELHTRAVWKNTWPQGVTYTEAECPGCSASRNPCLTLRLLAQPYANHPESREEWKP